MTEPADPRRVRRAFIARHHPDRGGDPVAFMAGLARLEQQTAPRPATRPIVTVRHHRGGVRLLLRHWRRWRRRHTQPRVR